MDDHTPIDLLSLTAAELCAAARARMPSGAGLALQVHRQATTQAEFAPEALGATARTADAWRRHFALRLPREVRRLREPAAVGGDTVKAVLARPDGQEYECVRIPMGEARASLCVSSQVGCRMACRFCETARMGHRDDLTAGEIVGQVVWARAQGMAPRSVVFMGMGEALDNADALVQALRVLNDPAGLRYAQDRLTVCTVGHVSGIRRLAALGWKRLNLSFSLNAPDDDLRATIMPVAAQWPLAEVQAALREFRQRPNFQLGVHYCLLPGINDGRAHARGIAEFCAPLGRVMVYLIPYNPGTVPLTRAPEAHEVDRFVHWLRAEGLPVRRRVTKGRDVMAACGQLGNVRLPRSRCR